MREPSALFPGEPRPLPRAPHIEAYRADRPPPPPVRHALGYERFVEHLRGFGMSPEALLDTWTFAHAIRAHRKAFDADPELLHSAVVFLGNAFIREHPDCVWTHTGHHLAVGTAGSRLRDPDPGSDEPPTVVPGWRWIGVDRTVPAILEADEARFAEFARVVEDWGPGSRGRPPRPQRRFASRSDEPGGEPPDPSGA